MYKYDHVCFASEYDTQHGGSNATPSYCAICNSIVYGDYQKHVWLCTGPKKKDEYPAMDCVEAPKNSVTNIKVPCPNYDAKTNYHVAGLAKCGLDIVRFPELMMGDEPQYIFPEIDPEGAVIGAYFIVGVMGA